MEWTALKKGALLSLLVMSGRMGTRTSSQEVSEGPPVEKAADGRSRSGAVWDSVGLGLPGVRELAGFRTFGRSEGGMLTPV